MEHMKKALLILFVAVDLHAFAQTAKVIDNLNGRWEVINLSNQILKCTFIPNGYTKAEQVSNAVNFLENKSDSKKELWKLETTNSQELVQRFVFDEQKSFSLKAYNFKDGHHTIGFSLQPDEQIFGAGERSLPMNRRGFRLPLYNNPWYGYSTNADALNYGIPFIISTKGYGIFFDNPSVGYIDIGKANADVLEFGFKSGALTFYLIEGKNVDEIVRNYHALTGTQPIPARWVFGNFMSRFGYRSQLQVDSMVKKMKAANFPMDAVIIDLFWFGDSIQHTMGNLEWKNKTKWPNPQKMIADLKAQNIKTILITEPFVLKETPNYEPSKKFHAVDSAGKPGLITNFYFGETGLLDLFRKDAGDWFWSKYKPQIDKGVGGWWGDLGEPEKHPNSLFHNLKDQGFTKRLFNAEDVHNIYGHFWSKLLFEKYAQLYPSERLFNLNRSGYAGTCRYGIFPWSGDVSRSWEGLQAQMPIMLGASISGIPYIHADAGGFAGGEKDNELYIRWLQFAQFTPVFRPHGTGFGEVNPGVTDIPSEPVMWDATTQKLAQELIIDRYRLLPYNYNLGYEQWKFGKPLVRPMFYYNSNDTNLLKATNQYMFGDAFLVAPVNERGAKTKRLYLPAGEWINWYSNEKMSGGRWLDAPLDMNHIPVFVKAGSFVPTKTVMRNTSEYDQKVLVVKYYPAAEQSSYTLYEDDGKTNKAWEKNLFDLYQFTGQATSSRIDISIQQTAQSKTNKATSKKLVIEIPTSQNNNRRVQVNGKVIPVVYDLSLNTTSFQVSIPTNGVCKVLVFE
jgi:oligosaccharide 4-alpha-D-glucosyltransferase